MGNVGKDDPEIRYMPNGTAVANFSMATSEQWTKDGQKQEKTSWHRITFFGPVVEKVISQYVKGGSKIFIEGMIDYQDWIDKETGAKKYATNIKGLKIKLLDKRDSSTPQGHQSAPQGQSQSQGGGGAADDDIPFAPVPSYP